MLIWKDLSDKEKTRLVLSQVLGYYIIPDEFVKSGELNLPRGVDAPQGFRWPIAYPDDGMVDGWMVKDIATDPKVFDPLHEMNDAWKIVEFMARRMDESDYNPRFRWAGPLYKGNTYLRAGFPHMLDFTTGEFRGHFLDGRCWLIEAELKKRVYTTLADTPHEAICLAALRVAGTRVVPEEPPPMRMSALERMWREHNE